MQVKDLVDSHQTSSALVSGVYVMESYQTVPSSLRLSRVLLQDSTGSVWVSVSRCFQPSESISMSVVSVTIQRTIYFGRVRLSLVRCKVASSAEIGNIFSLLPRYCAREEVLPSMDWLIAFGDRLKQHVHHQLLCEIFRRDCLFSNFAASIAAADPDFTQVGGLLKRTVHVMRIAERMATKTQDLKGTLVLHAQMAALIHDLGQALPLPGNPGPNDLQLQSKQTSMLMREPLAWLRTKDWTMANSLQNTVELMEQRHGLARASVCNVANIVWHADSVAMIDELPALRAVRLPQPNQTASTTVTSNAFLGATAHG